MLTVYTKQQGGLIMDGISWILLGVATIILLICEGIDFNTKNRDKSIKKLRYMYMVAAIILLTAILFGSIYVCGKNPVTIEIMGKSYVVEEEGLHFKIPFFSIRK